MKIRTEAREDYSEVYELNYQAFGNRDDESKLVERIRNSEHFVPELSIVAELNNEIVGHLLLSKASVVNSENHQNVIVLAPIAIKPPYQKQGIGSQLIHEGKKRCKEQGYGIILLIGHPSYYPKFGFMPAGDYGIELKQFKVPNEVFMVCEVIEGELQKCKGELIYPPTFFN
ncbi:GNAT family N-acetyltransferase [Paenibacillus sp. LMG 31456]|uniref:GNAT family N-acetyltransferase n=1 Tax=Paenibacillus foliorum TaxID=2654974 RepID=A0A972GVM0_9BACL|nr:GNAT family N-acetyltransferase [Paenibacillus foliorum]